MTERDEKLARIGELIQAPDRPVSEEDRRRAIERITGEDYAAILPLDVQRDALWSRVCPSLYLGATVEDLDPSTQAVIAGWGAASLGRNLILAGSVGVGKTHAALAAARERHRRGLSVAFWPTVELWDALRPGGDEDVLAEVCDVDVLVLDDLGMEKVTEWTLERLYLLVNRRHLDQRPTIATSNLIGKELRAAVSDRVYDRLVNERTVTVVFEGGSRRGRAQRG